MKLFDAETPDELKAMGSIEYVAQRLNEIVSPFSVQADSYERLFEFYLAIKENWAGVRKSPFSSLRAQLIFALNHVEGDLRLELLGLTHEHFEDPVAQKRWYRSVAQLIHPDKFEREPTEDEKSAFQALNDLLADLQWEVKADE